MEDNLPREISNDKQVPKNKRIVNEDGLFEAEEDCAIQIMYVSVDKQTLSEHT